MPEPPEQLEKRRVPEFYACLTLEQSIVPTPGFALSLNYPSEILISRILCWTRHFESLILCHLGVESQSGVRAVVWCAEFVKMGFAGRPPYYLW